MSIVDLAQIVGALGFVPAILWVARRLMRDPKGQAETRKLNIEAEGMIVIRLYAEIERLDREMIGLREELAIVKESAADEKALLERENKVLKGRVRRLTIRVEGLEAILKIGPISAEMQALVDELDRKTGAKP